MTQFFTNSAHIALIFVVLVAMFSMRILYFFFIARADDVVDSFHQNLTIGMFTLVVTALVVLLGLMDSTQQAVSSVTGRYGIVTFNIAGPAAIWITVFMITSRVLGSKSTVSPSPEAKGSGLNVTLERHYRTLGFSYYRNWFADLNAFRRVIEKSELHFIDDLLPKVFYHGPFGLIKPRKVINTTLFVYSGKKAVKFQRIRGEVRTDGEKRSQIYLAQTSSTQDGAVSCLHLVRSGDSLLQTARHAHGEWKTAPLTKIDILIVAIYEGDEIEAGDYVYVDVSKYVDLERMDDASVELALVCDRRIVEFNVWEVSASMASTEKPVPLMFRNLDAQTNYRNHTAIAKNAEQIEPMFDKWGQILDHALDGRYGECKAISKPEVESFLCKAREILAGNESAKERVSFQQLFRKPPATDCVFTKLKHQRNVILSTFSWD